MLLARAFVKDPELLILDEPLHGLDLYNRRLVKDVIELWGAGGALPAIIYGVLWGVGGLTFGLSIGHVTGQVM